MVEVEDVIKNKLTESENEDLVCEKKELFNPNGDDSLKGRKLICGNTTNLFNLNNVKYSWAKELIE